MSSRAVLNQLRESPGASYSLKDLVRSTGLSKGEIEREILALREDDLLTVSGGPGAGYRYCLKTTGDAPQKTKTQQRR